MGTTSKKEGWEMKRGCLTILVEELCVVDAELLPWPIAPATPMDLPLPEAILLLIPKSVFV